MSPGQFFHDAPCHVNATFTDTISTIYTPGTTCIKEQRKWGALDAPPPQGPDQYAILVGGIAITPVSHGPFSLLFLMNMTSIEASTIHQVVVRWVTITVINPWVNLSLLPE